jgi:hypothetical protein
MFPLVLIGAAVLPCRGRSRHDEILVVVGITGTGQTHGFQVVGAGDRPSRFPRPVQCRKQHPRQDGDDDYPVIAEFLRASIFYSLIAIDLQLYGFVFGRKILCF